jgi:hypothetical protein
VFAGQFRSPFIYLLLAAAVVSLAVGELPLFGVLRVGIPDAARPQAEEIVAALDLGHAADAPISDADDIAGLPA